MLLWRDLCIYDIRLVDITLLILSINLAILFLLKLFKFLLGVCYRSHGRIRTREEAQSSVSPTSWILSCDLANCYSYMGADSRDIPEVR